MVWAPDGNRLAFVGGEGQIYTIRPDGGDLQQVTHRKGGYQLHSWSPDGTSIAYRADFLPNLPGVDPYELYITDGAAVESLVLDHAGDVDILWTDR